MKITMNMADLKAVFDACKTFVSKDDARPMMKTIQMEFYDGVCTAYALDGIKIMTIKVPYSVGDEGVINVPIVKLPKGNLVSISDEGNEILFDFLETKQAARKIEGEPFKNPEKFFDVNSPVFTIGFNPRNLQNALEAFKDENGVKMEFTTPYAGCVITSATKKALVLPVRLRD